VHTIKNEIRKSIDPLIKQVVLIHFGGGVLEEYWDENPEGRYKKLLNNHTGRKIKPCSHFKITDLSQVIDMLSTEFY
jgi:hypothetical protein